MGTPASQLGSVINRILDLFTTFSDGLTDKIMEEKLKDVDLMVRAQAINNLLQKRQIQIFKQGDFIVYKQQTKEESARFRGLSPEDRLILQVIQNAGNMEPSKEVIHASRIDAFKGDYWRSMSIATVENISDFVRKSGIAKVELKVEELKQHKICYRGSEIRIQESSAFTSIPCGVCPVLRECTDDGLISPKTCVYYNKWLTF